MHAYLQVGRNKSVLGNRPIPRIHKRQQTLCFITAYNWEAPLAADRTQA